MYVIFHCILLDTFVNVEHKFLLLLHFVIEFWCCFVIYEYLLLYSIANWIQIGHSSVIYKYNGAFWLKKCFTIKCEMRIKCNSKCPAMWVCVWASIIKCFVSKAKMHGVYVMCKPSASTHLIIYAHTHTLWDNAPVCVWVSHLTLLT